MSELVESSKQRWGNSPATYAANSLRIAGFDVMEEWERPCMDRMAAIAASRGGVVLEVGYGMGIAAAALQGHDLDLHVVIEAHPDVLARCLATHRAALTAGSMHLLTGYWQDVTPMLASSSIDGILFDTFPVAHHEGGNSHTFPFFEEAYRLLKPGGVLTYFSSQPTTLGAPDLERLEQAGFAPGNVDFELCAVSPPESCTYWRASSIVVPTVVK